jgi:hypothetical protein
LFTEIISVFSTKSAHIMSINMMRDHSSETLLSATNGSVDQGKLCNVIFVDHRENGLLLVDVDLGVLQIDRVNSLQFSETVVRNQASSLLLWSTVISSERSRDTSG